MPNVKLTPGDYAGYIQRSVIGAELLTLTVREINRESDTVVDTELVDMCFQLCIETLMKHHLSTRQLMHIDVLDFISTSSSVPVRCYFASNSIKGDHLQDMHFKFDVKFIKTALCLVMTRLAHGKKRDLPYELQAEYQALTS